MMPLDFARLLQRQCLALIEKAPVPLCIVSRDLTPVYVNPAGARLLLNGGAGSAEEEQPGLTTFYKAENGLTQSHKATKIS